MNSLNREISSTIALAVEEATIDDDVLVVVVTGAGGRAFSAGADLKQRTSDDAAGGAPPPARGAASSGIPLADCPKPVIAAIDGYCLAGGLQTSLKCDIRIATEQSKFGMPEARRSLVAAGMRLDPERFVPLGEAMWINLTGSHMTAQRAYDIGLIQALVPDREALFAEVERVAGEIKQCAPLAVQALKKIIRDGVDVPWEYSSKLHGDLRERIEHSEDRLEGPKAFAEKRLAVWKGR
jgi:enoyl-CoA hydratase/carnithine racemase